MQQSLPRPATLPRLRPVTLPRLLLFLVLVGFAALLGRLVPLAADDFGIAGLFSTDEELAGGIVRRMLERRTLSPDHFFAYGALYHELAALVALPAALDGLSQRDVLIALRLVSLAGGLATLLLTYMLGRSLFGAWAGVLAAALIALSPELARWSIIAHPDTVQLALVCGTLLACTHLTRRYQTRALLLAVLLAGLAFATKYLGLLLLPLIALAALAGAARTGPWGRPALARFACDGAFAAGVFVATFALTNPYALIEWRRSLGQFQAEIAHARAGHVFVEAAGGAHWLTIILSPSFLPAVVGLFAALAALAAGYRVLSNPQLEGRGPRTILARVDGRLLIALWTGGYLLYLVVQIGYLAPRHALPLLPGLAVLAAGAVALLPARRLRPLAGVALVLATAIMAGTPLVDLAGTRRAQAAQLEADPRVIAGHWLAETYPPETVILRDAYAYVPPRFLRVTTTFGLTERGLAALEPDLVIVNEAIRGRFRNPEDARRYLDGEAAFRERAEAYAAVEQPGRTCYRLRRAFDGVQVYERGAAAGGTTAGCAP